MYRLAYVPDHLALLTYRSVKLTLLTICSLLLAYLLTVFVEEPAIKLLRGRPSSPPPAPSQSSCSGVATLPPHHLKSN